MFQYFVFEFNTNIELLLEKQLIITVIQPHSICRKRKILGFVSLDVFTIWSQPGKSRNFFKLNYISSYLN